MSEVKPSDMYQMTRLDAVNEIMKLKTSERIANAGELATVPQAVEANGELDLATVTVQTQFEWFYNRVENGTLTSDNDGIVTLPDELSFITIHQTDASVQAAYLRPVDGKIYDTYNHTYNIGVARTVRYSGKVVWDFEKLPVAFQMLAIAYARKQVAGGNSHFSPTRLVEEKSKYNDAFQTVMKFDDSLSGGRFRNPAPTRRRPPRNGGWV